ncbi:hypothetical protein [Horticoccus sp. 23ND18S-11]|uniref:hypothetical protein n=1 Tax=Horticoccus sp. 23ND18S-11 TaxID=3391832 RepID=UPI0039C9F8AB
MIHFVVAFALLLHVLFWGAGAAMLAMPAPWRRFWPVLVIPAGLALQSAVVWLGAHTGLPGTQAYAWWSELIPFGLLIAGVRQRGWDPILLDVTRFGVVWATVAGCLALLVLPVAIASKSLTTISLGSCDAADYAAGARVLMEFAAGDRSGFLGLTEVVRVQSVDNFFDYWIRLNHFTPSALMALNGTVLACAPHEIATLLTAVLLASALPAVFWSARAIVGYSGGVSVIIAGLFGISPVTWYAFAHVSPGQLLAAQAVVWLTWAGVSLWRGRLTWRRSRCFWLALAIGYWLVLGSYNFFLLVCLVPAAAYAGGLTLWTRAWVRLGRWLAMMLLPLVVVGGLFFERVAGLAERFTLLRTYDFGWPVPGLAAEGWLGMVRGPDLLAWDFFGLRWVLAAAVVGLLAWAFLRAAQQRVRALWLVIAITAPVLGAYLWLEARGARLNTNASYDAYKLFAVFYPLLLPAFCWWVTLRRSRKLHEWLLVGGVALVVIAFNLAGCGMFIWKLSRPPLLVDRELRQLRTIETMPDVKSVNLLIPDMWSRLWAHAFLLRKGQYFLTHTYEGRLNTPLRGEWDLEGGIVAVDLPDAGRRQVSARFALVDTRAPSFMRAEPGEGWHAEEFDPRSLERWRWTRAQAGVKVHNPHAYPLVVECALDAWSPAARRVGVKVGAGPLSPLVTISEKRARVALPAITIAPGDTVIVLASPQPAITAPGDPRPLGECVFRLRLSPRRE